MTVMPALWIIVILSMVALQPALLARSAMLAQLGHVILPAPFMLAQMLPRTAPTQPITVTSIRAILWLGARKLRKFVKVICATILPACLPQVYVMLSTLVPGVTIITIVRSTIATLILDAIR
jgi:hypothetical protein